MNRLFLIFFIIFSLSSCHSVTNEPSQTMSVKDQDAVLVALSQHMQASITDLTKSQRTPTDQLLLKSYYPLSSKELKAIEVASHLEGSFSSDVADKLSCALLRADLQNESGEKVSLADTVDNPLYFQRFGLREYDKKLCQQVGIYIRTNKSFSALKGTILLQVSFGTEPKKLIDIPVNISTKDNLKQ